MWLSRRTPPVPIPNTVEKTSRADNTWEAAPWEDRSLQALKFIKQSLNNFMLGSVFSCVILLRIPPASRKTCDSTQLLLGRVIPNTVEKTFIADNTHQVVHPLKTPQGCFHSVRLVNSSTELGRLPLTILKFKEKL